MEICQLHFTCDFLRHHSRYMLSLLSSQQTSLQASVPSPQSSNHCKAHITRVLTSLQCSINITPVLKSHLEICRMCVSHIILVLTSLQCSINITPVLTSHLEICRICVSHIILVLTSLQCSINITPVLRSHLE